ncbi:MAG: hypothetical protein ABIQ93_09540, partial [Saprospiraceae bacterium]
HLPTRQKKSFKGLGIKLIAQFMERFLPENIPLEKVAAPVLKTFPPAPEQSVQAIDFLGNMVPLVNGQEPEDLVVTAAENTPATIPAILEIPAAESTETGQKPSLAQRLREQMQSADLKAPGGSRAVVQPPVTAPSAATAWELPKTVAAIPERQKEEKVNQPEPVFMPVSGKSRLLERLQEEFQADSLANLQSGNK